MSNVANRQWPHNQSPAGWPTTTNAAQPTTQPWPTVRMPTVPPAAAEILRDAVWHIDAAEHQASGANAKTVRNLGWGGAILNARCGSTTVADTNDPLFLPYYGTPYLYSSANTWPGITSPASVALTITGDIDLRAHVALASYASAWVIFSRTMSPTGQSYSLGLGGSSELRLTWSVDGVMANAKKVDSTVSIPVAAGGDIWLRATLSVATNYQVIFYTSSDGVSWVQLGDVVNGVGPTSIFPGQDVMCIGSGDGFAYSGSGAYYRVQVYNGIDGTLVFDADTSVLTSGSQTTFVEKSSNAATVTINRATSGRKSVAVVAPVWLFGTDDYMEVRDHPLLNVGVNDSMTVLAITRPWATQTPDDHGIIAKRAYSSTAAGWLLEDYGNFIGSYYCDGLTAQATISRTVLPFDGSIRCTSLVFDRVTRVASIQVHTTPLSARGSWGGGFVNNQPLSIGRWGPYVDMEFMSAAIFRRALSASEISTLTTYLTGKYK